MKSSTNLVGRLCLLVYVALGFLVVNSVGELEHRHNVMFAKWHHGWPAPFLVRSAWERDAAGVHRRTSCLFRDFSDVEYFNPLSAAINCSVAVLACFSATQVFCRKDPKSFALSELFGFVGATAAFLSLFGFLRNLEPKYLILMASGVFVGVFSLIAVLCRVFNKKWAIKQTRHSGF